MLRIIVESASGIPKKKIGNPDPIVAVVFRGETVALSFFSEETIVCSVNSFLGLHDHVHSVLLSIKISSFLSYLRF